MPRSQVTQWGATQYQSTFFGLVTPPTNVYLALAYGLVDETADGTTVGALEVPTTSTGYSRLQIPTGSANWEVLGDGVVANSNELEFDTPTADWGSITHFFIASAATAGQIYVGQELSEPFYVRDGVTPILGAGALAFTLTAIDELLIM